MKIKLIWSALLALLLIPTLTSAGELYDELEGLSKKEVMYHLFEKTSFDKYDIEDLDLLWLERDFSTQFVVKMFEKYRKNNPQIASAYQEVILWHTEIDVIPSTTTKEEFDLAAQLFHEKSALFGGTVRVIGGFLDDSEPYRKGICRWVAPNTFVMLYVVRLAREPFFGPVFPMDGGTMVSQTLH
ncbi:hypothetical protein EZV61_09395 [Corallincola luteus]|uniref:Uncharacterized protein n=1 Tax=Corallincola luteus TaxID=1775177 RepID=A0ABY2ALE5_9GAMM|nr:hypothetical protein [Corallincola luteus]TCI03744.1 hypothetical protein EZV61_09395 [Corallincola luteus]